MHCSVQNLLTLQNHLGQIGHCISPDSEKLNQFFSSNHLISVRIQQFRSTEFRCYSAALSARTLCSHFACSHAVICSFTTWWCSSMAAVLRKIDSSYKSAWASGSPVSARQKWQTCIVSGGAGSSQTNNQVRQPQCYLRQSGKRVSENRAGGVGERAGFMERVPGVWKGTGGEECAGGMASQARVQGCACRLLCPRHCQHAQKASSLTKYLQTDAQLSIWAIPTLSR